MTSSNTKDDQFIDALKSTLSTIRNIQNTAASISPDLNTRICSHFIKISEYILAHTSIALDQLTIYKSYRIPILQTLEILPYEAEEHNRIRNINSYIAAAEIEYFCIFEELLNRKETQQQKDPNFQDALKTHKSLSPAHREYNAITSNRLKEISAFRAILNNKYEDSRAMDGLNKIERKADSLEKRISVLQLFTASERMVETWKTRSDQLNEPIEKKTKNADQLQKLSVIWPAIMAFTYILSNYANDPNPTFLELLPLFSLFTITEVLIIYYFRIIRIDLKNLINEKNLIDHRLATSEFMASYFEYLKMMEIDLKNTVEKVDDLLFGRSMPIASDKEISPYNLAIKLPDINQNIGK